MSLAIYPLNLGEIELDFSFTTWQTNCGTKISVPVTAWLITGHEKPILVDSGFRSAEDVLAATGSPCRRSSEQTLTSQLAKHNLQPSDIGTIIHTHLHLDHCGLDDQLPNARILLQRAELQYGSAPLFPTAFYDRQDMATLVGKLWNRVELLDEECELFPGIRTVITRGHTPAHQMVYVELASGTAVITGDAAYSVEYNVKRQIPFGYYIHLEDVMAGLRRIAQEGKFILPTHDGSVHELYSAGLR